MNYSELTQLKNKLYFTVDDIAEIKKITRESARTLLTRYTSKGTFLRIKNNFYILRENLDYYQTKDFMSIANFLQVPSYISLTTALSEWGVTTQLQQGVYESCCVKRSIEYAANDNTFKFYKLNRKYYSGFIKRKQYFIAEKEKALTDSLYLYSFGKYSLDIDALELNKFDKKKLQKWSKIYPEKTQKTIRKICKI